MAGGNKLAAVRVFLENGAKPNETDPSGETPLHWAVEGRVSSAIIQLLLKAGASPRKEDREGKTPIDYIESIPPPLREEYRKVLIDAARNARAL
jgi:ankyrin repeat protein